MLYETLLVPVVVPSTLVVVEIEVLGLASIVSRYDHVHHLTND